MKTLFQLILTLLFIVLSQSLALAMGGPGGGGGGDCFQENTLGTITACSNCSIIDGVASGDIVSDASLVVQADGCGPVTLTVEYSFDWNQGADLNWIHGISFLAGPLWTNFETGTPPDWIYMPSGVTGCCSGETYGAGFFYDGTDVTSAPSEITLSFMGAGMCTGTWVNTAVPLCGGICDGDESVFIETSGDCNGDSLDDVTSSLSTGAGFPNGFGANDGDPSNNWGINCTTDCPTFEFELTYCPNNTTPADFTEYISFTTSADGESGCWCINAGCDYSNGFDVTIMDACGPDAAFDDITPDFCNAPDLNLNNVSAGYDLGAEWSGSTVTSPGDIPVSFSYCDNINNTSISHIVGENGCYNGPITDIYEVWTPILSNIMPSVTEVCGSATVSFSADVQYDDGSGPLNDWFANGGTGTLEWLENGSPVSNPITLTATGCNAILRTFTPNFNTGCAACDVMGTPISIILSPTFTLEEVPLVACGTAYANMVANDGTICDMISVSCPNSGDVAGPDAYSFVGAGGTPCEATFTGTVECSCISCIAEAGMVASVTPICPGVDIAASVSGNTTDPGYTTLFIFADGDNILEVNSSGVYTPALTCNVTYTVYSFNYDDTDATVVVPTSGALISGIDCDAVTGTPCCDLSVGFDVVVTDTEMPVLLGVPADITVCVGMVPPMIDLSWTDNCDGTGTVSGMDVSDGATCPEIITRTWTYTDACSNTAMQMQLITVGDLEAPILEAPPADITVCVGLVPNAAPLNWTDNCDGNGMVNSTDVTDGATCPEIITRTWEYTDACGNMDTEIQIITVGDINPPTLDAPPADLSVCVGNVPAMTSLNWSDDCDGSGTVLGSDLSDNNTCPEIITRTWEYTDACGNTDTEIQTITVGDDQAPTIAGVPMAITVECIDDFNASFGVIPTLTWTDNCSAGGSVVGTQAPDPSTLDCNGGVITRTWTIMDACNNTATETQIITIDPAPPIIWTTALPADITINCTQGIPSPITLDYSNNAVSSNCSESGTVTSTTTGAITVCNTSLTYEWEIADPCTGTLLTHSQTVTLEDTSTPVFSSYPADITFGCIAELTAADVITVMDDCDTNPMVTFMESSTPDPIDCAGGTITRTWSYTNPCDVTETHIQTITVDPVDPIVWTTTVPSDATIDCPSDLSLFPLVDLSYSNNEANAACLENGVNVAPVVTGSIVNCGDTEVRMWEVTDACGNVLTAMQTITYQDNELPQFTVAPGSITYDCASELPAMIDLSFTDNCLSPGSVPGVETGTIDACAGGSITREWTITDDCNNTQTHTQNITVNPVPQIDWTSALPGDMDVNCGDTAPVAGNLNYSNAAANASCLIDGSEASTEIGSLATCGDQLIRTWTITPSCGVTITHVQTLTSVDIEDPVVIGVPGDATYDCLSDVPTMPVLDYTDNCAADGMVTGVEATNPDPITCDGGMITRTWIVMDDCGNETTEIQVITVNPTPPIDWVSTPSVNINIQCNDPVPSPPILNYTNSATCLVDGMSIAVDDGAPLATCGDIRTYTWTETDACANTITFQQTITLLDTEDPVLSSTPGNATYDCLADVVAAPSITWTDNCDGSGPANYTEVDDVSDECIGGMITRTWDYTDACGNPVTHTQTITVLPKPDITWDSEFSNIIVQCGDPIVPFGDLDYSNNATNATCVEQGTVVASIMPPTIATCGDVQTHTWTITSSCGTVLTSMATITIVDGDAPTFDVTPPLNQTITCLADIPASDDLAWTDTCDGNGFAPYVDDGTIDLCTGGSITRTWSVTDACGNGPVTASTTFSLAAPVFTTCNDGDDCTTNDMEKMGCDGVTICVPCAGVLSDCTGDVTMVPCDDGVICTENDMRGEACNGDICIPCAGTPVAACSGVVANIVQACDDGDDCTTNDIIEIDGCDMVTVCAPCMGTPNPTPDPTFTQPAPICEDESVVITADPCVGGTLSWLDGPGGSVLTTGSTFTTPTLTTTTSYYIVCNVNGCLSNEIEIVAVVNPPATVMITGDMDICAGQETTTLTATPGFITYDWGSGSGTDNTLVVTTQGSYAVTATDANGCTGTATFNVSEDAIPDISIGGSTSFCPGGSTTISVPAGFTYIWSPNGETTNIINVTTAGDYSITVTDANGCTDTDIVTVSEQATLTLNVTGDLNICENETATLDLGTDYPTILWSPGGEITQVITVMPTSTSSYTVEVTDANGCTGSTMVQVVVNIPIEPTILNAEDICPGQSITLDAGAGYTGYTWSDGSLNQTTIINTTGTYTVTVTDINGCTSTDEVIINPINPPTPTITGDLTLCPDGLDMVVLTTETGFVDYIWSQGGTNNTITVSTAGTYQVTVTDASGCTGSTAVVVSLDTAPPVNISGLTSICFGSTTTLDAGIGYTAYDWGSGNTDQTLIISTGGTYTVTVTDANGCTNEASININEQVELMPTIVGDLEICPVDGMTTLTLTNAYTSYDWGGGTTTASFDVTMAGSYSVTVTDAFGCTGSTSVDVTEFNTTPVNISGDTEFCQSMNTTLTADTGFDTYIWSNGVGGPSITINTENTYTVTVTDINGCTSESSVVVTEIPTPIVDITGDVSFCIGDDTTLDAGIWTDYQWNIGGQVTQTIMVATSQLAIVTVTDVNGCTGVGQVQVTANNTPTPIITGSSSFCTGSSTTLSTSNVYTSYVWSDLTTAGTLNVTVAGIYSVTVTDANGCTGVDDIVVSESTALNPTISGPTVVCSGDDIMLNAGTGFDTYDWNNGLDNGQILTVTTAGVYTVVVTDATGCSGSSSVVVIEELPVLVDLPDNDFYCQGQSVVIDAGAGFVNYDWSNSFNTQTITVSTDGVYSVTTTDINGCTSSDQITITESLAPVPVFISGDQYCPGESLTLELGGSYDTYFWNTSETASTIDVSVSGLYSVTVTDAQGCEGNASITVTAFPTVAPTIGGSTSFCSGGFTTLDAGTYVDYIWSTGEMTQIIQVADVGFYTVTVTDANGCTGTDQVEISIQTSLNPIITGDLDFCSGDMTTLNAGSGFDQYQWDDSNNSVTQFIDVNIGGDYTVTVTDVSGCSGSATVTVTELALPVVAIAGLDAFCFGGDLTITATPGFVDYSWLPAGSGPSLVVNTAGFYTVIVTDANGCTNSEEIQIFEIPEPVPTITGDLLYCQNETTTLDVGAWAMIEWSTSENSNTIEVATPGLVSVTVTDNNSCTGVTSVNISPYPTVDVAITGSSAFCAGGTTTLGADGIFDSYDWSGPQVSTDPTIVVNTEGDYTLIVTDTNGCTASATVAVSLQTSLSPVITGDIDLCEGSNGILDAGSAFDMYNWSGPGISGSSSTIMISEAGIYAVTVEDASGCTGTDEIEVTVNPNPSPVVEGQLAYCQGSNTILTVNGYVQYLWSTGNTGNSIQVATPGMISVTVTDSNNCTGETTVEVTEAMNPIPMITGVASFCPSSSTDLDIGSTWSSVIWSSGETTSIIAADAAQVYTATVTDANMCTGVASINVTAFNVDPVTIGGSSSYCIGSSTILDAGAQFVDWVWSTGESNVQTIQLSTEGVVSVTVTDVNGCTSTGSINVTEETSLIVNILGDTEICEGESTILDGGGSFGDWSWSTGDMGVQTITVTTAGTYTVTVTDIGGGCSGTGEVTVLVNNAPAPNIVGNENLCPGDMTTLTLDDVYTTYLWSDGSMLPSLDVSMGGIYMVTVTDNATCTAIDQIIINQNLNPSVISVNTDCSLDMSMYNVILMTDGDQVTNDLGATVIDNNGTFTIADIDTMSMINITISNTLTGCDTMITVTPPDCSCQVNADAGLDQTLTCDIMDATLGGSMTSVGSNYSYEWYDDTGLLVANTEQYTTSVEGVYTLIVTETVIGCTSMSEVTVSSNITGPAVIIYANPDNMLDCYIDIVVLTTDEADNVVYIWTLSDNTIVQGTQVMIESATTATLTAIDTLTGCSSFTSLDIPELTEYPFISLATTEDLDCINDMVLINAVGSQSSPDIVYQWTDIFGNPIAGETSLTLSVDTPGQYILEASDASNGCVNQDTISVLENMELPLVDAGVTLSVPCDELTIDLNGDYSNSAANSTANWTSTNGVIVNGATTNTPSVNGPGLYYFTVVNQDNGCQSIDSVLVTSPDIPQEALITAFDPDCEGEDTGTIDIGDISGGTAPYNYTIDNTTNQTGMFDNLSAGTYQLNITDINGCEMDTVIVLEDGTGVNIDMLIMDYELRLGDSIQVQLDINPTYDNLEDTLIWSITDNVSCLDCIDPYISTLTSQNYTVTVIDEFGCTDQVSFLVAVEDGAKVYIPNVFNPNSTVGNSVFTVYSDDYVEEVLDLKIYDRWGELVFSNKNFPPNDLSFGWDGHFKGEEVVLGVYVYVVSYRIVGGREEVVSGDVTILR